MRLFPLTQFAVVSAFVVTFGGCSNFRTTETARTGLEQLLISNAVDQSLDKVDFTPFQGTKVFLDEKYLEGVDSKYVVASVRHRIMSSGATLTAKSEDSDITVELRSGGVGTDKKETFIGLPEIAVPFPLPLQLPEVRLFNSSTQYGTAKLGLVAYATKSGEPLGSGGTSLARSDDKNRYVFGVGPFNSGTVRQEVSTSTGRRSNWQVEMFSDEKIAAIRKPQQNVVAEEQRSKIEPANFERRRIDQTPDWMRTP